MWRMAMVGRSDDNDVGLDDTIERVWAKRSLPRWVGLIFFAVCLGLIPQIIYLSSSLNEVNLANHWRTVWVGLDIAEAVVFLLTAWFLFRGSILVTITASMAAVMLWLDAWFDVLTSFTRADIDAATNLAVFLEVPLGVFCLYVALRPLLALRLPRGRKRAV
jgi:DMSO reductase anchor subunit